MRSAILLVALLGGCSLAPGGAQFRAGVDTSIDKAIDDVKHFNDKMAETLPKINCAVTIGAYARLPESDEKTGLGLMCGLLHTGTPMIEQRPGVVVTPVQP